MPWELELMTFGEIDEFVKQLNDLTNERRKAEQAARKVGR